jgi:catechol 2,3-dioxygenase-like lactoylglutathione lyase family enzyme
MLMMRVHIYLPTANAADSIRFFVDQLKLFKVAKDLGMGNVLLQHTKATDFHLMLSPDDPVRAGSALFSISVPNCEAEFNRISGIKFDGEAGILRNSVGGPEFIEYALGKFFKLRDPAGNIFTIYEWFS